MGLFKKYDWWSIMDGLEDLIDYDYRGNEKDSIYWDFYSEQITELSLIAADMYNDMYAIKSKLYFEMPEKHIEFCEEDDCTQVCIAWWNTAACMFSDVDMSIMLENENKYNYDCENEKEKRIRALEKLTKKQYMLLNTLVIGFITRYTELVNAFDVITSCIRELDYHQSAVKSKDDVNLPNSAWI